MQETLLIDRFAPRAEEAAELMRALANGPRLLILCHLITAGEMSVSALAGKVGLGQSALSQHLAKLRGQGIVAYRREAQTLFYRVADDKAARLLALLRDLFCPELLEKAP